MKRLIEYPLTDGGSVIVEVDEQADDVTFAARSGEVIEKSSESFEKVMDRVKPMAEVIIARLSGLSEPPNEIGVEFGIKLSAGAGAVLATAGVEANYKVTEVDKKLKE